MILDLKQSRMFTIDPDIRFCEEYLLPLGTWRELWRRYKLLDYTNADLRDFLFIKHARNMSAKSMDRWITRSEIYMLAKTALDKGASKVNSEIFRDYEQYVLDEVTKAIRFGGHQDSRVII